MEVTRDVQLNGEFSEMLLQLQTCSQLVCANKLYPEVFSLLCPVKIV